MRRLHQNPNFPWLMIGDLNEILFLHEKEGGNPRPHQYMVSFQSAIEDCNLRDLGYLGDPFTWRRGSIQERLDRGLINEEWAHLFPNAALENLPFARSDHRPLLVDTDYYINLAVGGKNGRPKSFEARWLREEKFSDTVKEAWDRVRSNQSLTNIHDKLASMHGEFHDWDQRVLKKPKKRLRKAQRELEEAMTGPMTDENEEKRKELSELIEYLLELEEIQWMQRSRANWLKSGDRNTSFFHAYASARRKRNFIKNLKDENGTLLEGTDVVKNHIASYFTNLFTSEVNHTDPVVLQKVAAKVTEPMNEMLMQPYDADDVRKAVFSIGDLKAPGPDGLHAVFFKKYWDILGPDITQEVLFAINSRQIPAEWNDTTIVMIPKVDSPEVVTQFRPISLCNVLYKIISKMLAARLKSILPEIISPTQSAFVPGRLITDNILVAYECVHKIKNKRSGQYGLCAVKLDMHKAYDRVEWVFLRNIM